MTSRTPRDASALACGDPLLVRYWLQAAVRELGTGPRWEQTQRAQSGLPAGPAQDETQLGKALLALAERFKRSEKRNAAIASLAERMESAEFGGQEVSVMAERIG